MSTQYEGTLRSWNDDRGFGFIAPRDGGREVFVHISAFARDGSRPTPGEILCYELAAGSNGKPQAVRVIRKAVGKKPPVHARGGGGSKGSWLGNVVAAALIVVVGAVLFKPLQGIMHRSELGSMPPVPSEPAIEMPTTELSGNWRCDGRQHCSQMTSCAEASWFINNCPGTKMDGDGDGVPCEQQWCAIR